MNINDLPWIISSSTNNSVVVATTLINTSTNTATWTMRLFIKFSKVDGFLKKKKYIMLDLNCSLAY